MEIKLIFLLSILAVHTCLDIERPHILFIVGDDVGWNDVSLHGSNTVMTPNIDMIGLQGIVLENYYTDPHGTPSRGALFTGKYSMHTGTQGRSIGSAEDRGLPISERILPSYLQELGYVTHMIGKWQLGHSREYYLPTNRGFDSFYGFLGGSVDYYTYNHIETCNESVFNGLDLFNDLEPDFNQTGHLTTVLTEEAVKVIQEHNESVPLYMHFAHGDAHAGGGMVNLQPPAEYIAANGHIAHSARRLHAGMMMNMDQSVGRVISALAEKGILNNTLIIFVSDNGAAPTGWTQNYGSNLPLRGTKATPWEGAVRTPAFIWHSNIESKIWKGLFHVTDWLRTLMTIAGGNMYDVVDGKDQWNAIVNDEKSQRTEVIIAADDLNEWGAFRDGDLKIIVGNVNNCTSGHYGREYEKLRYDAPSYEEMLLTSESYLIFKEILGIPLDINAAIEKRKNCSLPNQNMVINNTMLCVPTKSKGCLFNISADPEEVYDLWDSHPKIATEITLRFRLLWANLVPRKPPVFDVRADPALRNYVWFWWLDNTAESSEPPTTTPQYPLTLTIEEMQYFLDINMKVFNEKLNSYFKHMTETFMHTVGGLFS